MSGDGDDALGDDLESLFGGAPPAPLRSAPTELQPTVREELVHHATEATRTLGTLAIDCVFLIIAGLLTVASGWFIEQMNFSASDAQLFHWIQWMIGGGTVGAVAIRVLAEFLVLARRAWRQVAGK